MRRSMTLGLAWLLGCGGSQQTTTTGASTSLAADGATASTTRRNADVITQEEIAQASGVTNAYDLVRRLRPNFLRNLERTSLRANSSAPLVRLNGQVLGETTELRSVEISAIQEIRYYSIVQAESMFSGDRGRPVIAVTTKKLR